ncbi:hypothetical protein F5Y17DRAFT_413788 [Xylariaceae sp. FL0594]|nr:hypothetical protein F5Y17DRAFT_413788 [Xylariaceae sp. FL0594]
MASHGSKITVTGQRGTGGSQEDLSQTSAGSRKDTKAVNNNGEGTVEHTATGIEQPQSHAGLSLGQYPFAGLQFQPFSTMGFFPPYGHGPLLPPPLGQFPSTTHPFTFYGVPQLQAQGNIPNAHNSLVSRPLASDVPSEDPPQASAAHENPVLRPSASDVPSESPSQTSSVHNNPVLRPLASNVPSERPSQTSSAHDNPFLRPSASDVPSKHPSQASFPRSDRSLVSISHPGDAADQSFAGCPHPYNVNDEAKAAVADMLLSENAVQLDIEKEGPQPKKFTYVTAWAEVQMARIMRESIERLTKLEGAGPPIWNLQLHKAPRRHSSTGFRNPRVLPLSNLEALFVSMRGTVQTGGNMCDKCQKRHGSFVCYIVMDGHLNGACSNCHYNNSGSHCSFRTKRFFMPMATLDSSTDDSDEYKDEDNDSDDDSDDDIPVRKRRKIKQDGGDDKLTISQSDLAQIKKSHDDIQKGLHTIMNIIQRSRKE